MNRTAETSCWSVAAWAALALIVLGTVANLATGASVAGAGEVVVVDNG